MKTPTHVVEFTALDQVGPDTIGWCDDDALCLALLMQAGLLGKVQEKHGFDLTSVRFHTPTHYVLVNLHSGNAKPHDNGYTAAAIPKASFSEKEASVAFSRILKGLNPNGRFVREVIPKPQYKA